MSRFCGRLRFAKPAPWGATHATPNHATSSFHTQRSGVWNPPGFKEQHLHVAFVGWKPPTSEGIGYTSLSQR
jgi:hypothetical protein